MTSTAKTADRTVPRFDQATLLHVDINRAPRKIVLKTRGSTHGPITRLVSPHDIGEIIKPFVFLDHGVSPEHGRRPFFSIHPHSGIATLTAVLRGGIDYEDTTGKSGVVLDGGVEWMKAGNGVWHDGGFLEGKTTRLFQLWVALPPEQENSAAESQYISSDELQEEGPARVLMGRYGKAASPVRAPEGMNYLHVNLKPGQRWTYVPPSGHTVAWLAVDEGRLHAQGPIGGGELAVFEESESPIELEAEAQTSFVFGSAVKHPHPLVTGYYSVHTSPDALARGEAEIRRIGRQLRAEGRL